MDLAKAIWGGAAPFGRVGRALGWRWIMPIGTIPLPFNPWIALALPYLVAGWVMWPALVAGAFAWWRPLILWLLLALPLSVPVVQWALFAFRLHQLQALMPPVAMLILAGAVARGQAPGWMAVLPAGFFGCHLVGAVAGRLMKRRLLANDAALMAQRDRPGALPLLALDRDGAPGVAELMRHLGLPALVSRGRDGTRVLHRRIVASAGGDWAERAQRAGCLTLDAPRDGVLTLTTPLDAAPPGTVTLRPDAGGWLERRLLGRVQGFRADGSGVRLRYGRGQVAPFSWLPAFPLFVAGYFSGGGRPTTTAGFVRARATMLGDGALSTLGMVDAVVGPLRRPDLPAPTLADADAVRAEVAMRVEAAIAAAFAALDALIADPIGSAHIHFPAFDAAPERIDDRAEAMTAALEQALARAPTLTDPQAADGVIALARVLSMLPDAAFRRVGHRLLPVLAAPAMASGEHWYWLKPSARARIRPGGGTWSSAGGKVVQLRGATRFTGFRLIPFAEQLYERLGDLGTPARPVIDDLIRRYGPVPPLVEARRRLG